MKHCTITKAAAIKFSLLYYKYFFSSVATLLALAFNWQEGGRVKKKRVEND